MGISKKCLCVLLFLGSLATAQQVGTPHGNPCVDPIATLQTLNVSMSTTSATQLIALSGTTKIYLCSLVVGWGGEHPRHFRSNTERARLALPERR